MQPFTQPSARRTLAVASGGTLLVLAVFSALVVSIADSSRSLHAGIAGQAWALSGMSLGLATALLSAGALGDDIGHGRVLRWSAVLLAAASVLGALAGNVDVLVAARVLQGVTGGGILAAGLGSLGQAFPAGPERTRATGIWGAAVGGGITIGPLAGAALAAAVGWRGGFWLEAAGALTVAIAARPLSGTSAPARHRIDVPGVATLGGGMALLTGALVEGRRHWTGGLTLALVAAAAVALAAFAAIQRRRRHPMLDLALFGEQQFLASITGALFTGLAVVGLMSYSPSVMQGGLHLTAIGSAALLAAWSATSMVVALAARRLMGRLRSQTALATGLALAALGEAGLVLADPRVGWDRLLPGLLIAGIGSGLANAALGRIAVESVPRTQAGMGSGANNTARYLGGAAGVALVVSVASRTGPGGLIDGWHHAATVSAGLCALGALLVALMRRQ
jgi:MFS family permease